MSEDFSWQQSKYVRCITTWADNSKCLTNRFIACYLLSYDWIKFDHTSWYPCKKDAHLLTFISFSYQIQIGIREKNALKSTIHERRSQALEGTWLKSEGRKLSYKYLLCELLFHIHLYLVCYFRNLHFIIMYVVLLWERREQFYSGLLIQCVEQTGKN